MRNLLRNILFVFIATSHFLFADDCAECCLVDCCQTGSCGIEIGADFVWWKPCIDQLEFAGIVSTSTSIAPPAQQSVLNIKPVRQHWEPGFKVYAIKRGLFCGLDLRGSYQYVDMQNSTSLSTSGSNDFIISPLLNPFALTNDGSGISIVGAFDVARGQYEATYQYWDALFAYPICYHNHYFYPNFGVAGIIFHQELQSGFFNQANNQAAYTRWSSCSGNVGLKIGTDYEYCLCNGLSLYSQADAALLVGCSYKHFRQFVHNGATDAASFIGVNNSPNQYHLVPGYHLAIGLSYKKPIRTKVLTFRIGYEFLSWFNLPNHQVFSGGNLIGAQLNSGSINKRTLGFHGLMIGANLSF